MELVLEDISTFDSENPIVGSLLRELDVEKKKLASDLIKQAPNTPGVDFSLKNRLSRLKDVKEPTDDNISPLSSSPAMPPDPGPFQAPPPPLSPGGFFQSFQPPPP